MNFKCHVLNCEHNNYTKSENDTGVCHCTEDIELEPGDCCGLTCSQYTAVEQEEEKIDVRRGSKVYDSNSVLLGEVTTIDKVNGLVVFRKLNGMMAHTTIDYVKQGLEKVNDIINTCLV
jgi:hypothetical protein